MNIVFTANSLGVCALSAFAIAIIPNLNSLLKLPLKHRRQMLQIARYGLLATVCLGLSHGLLMTQREDINFYDLSTYWAYAAGLFAFNLLAFLAFMYGELKSDFKKLNYFCCGALFLIICHVGQIIF